MNRLVVRDYNPSRLAAIAAGALAIIVLSGWGLFEYGRHRAGVDIFSAQDEADRLTDINEELEATIVSLQEQQAVLERSQQIEREAYKQLEATVGGLQDEISELKSELAFYRGIVAPKDAAGGLRVQSFDLTHNGLTRGYRYKLVLTQVLKNDTVARGYVDVSIEGTKQGRITVLNLADLVADNASELAYKFKYFQNFEGDLELPEGFVPVRITVKVSPRDQRHQQVEKVFDWPAA